MREPVKIGGVSGGMVVLGALLFFTSAIFPPLGLVVAFAAAMLVLQKWSRRRADRRGAKAHRARMDQFYFEQDWREREFTNPGWRL